MKNTHKAISSYIYHTGVDMDASQSESSLQSAPVDHVHESPSEAVNNVEQARRKVEEAKQALAVAEEELRAEEANALRYAYDKWVAERIEFTRFPHLHNCASRFRM